MPTQYKEFLARAFVIQLREGSFSATSLSRETGKSYGYSSNMTKRMLSSGLVARVSGLKVLGSGGRGNLRGLSPALYTLSRKGRSCIRVALAGGVFDIIHPGHVHFLREARDHGDALVVVLARDSTVRASKRVPVNNESDRLNVMSSLRQVGLAMLGSPHGHDETLRKVKPDVVCLGYDQEGDLRRIEPLKEPLGFGIARISRTRQDYSTSRILRAIKASSSYNNL